MVVHDFALGGAERIALRLANVWAQAGHSVTIATGSEEGPLRTIVGPNVRVIAATPAIARSFTRYRLARFVADLCRRNTTDILFLPGNYYFDVAPLVRLFLGRATPRIIGKISNAIIRPREKRLKAIGRVTTLWAKAKALDWVVTTSAAGRAEAQRWLRGDPARFTAIAQPVLDSLPTTLDRPRDIDLIAAGRLEPQKNFALLLDMVARLPADRHLTLLGDGAQRATLEQQAQALGIADRVHFTGFVPDIRPWLQRARLFVLSSDYEGFPSVLVEALACGLPVVATACAPSIAELVPTPAVGRIVPPRDTDAMARAVLSMAAQPAASPQTITAVAAPYRLGQSAAAWLALFGVVTHMG